MSYSAVLTPIAVVLELAIVILGIYTGYVRKKPFAYFFAITFLIFAAFDALGSIGISTDVLASLNIIAILSALAGMYLVFRPQPTP